MAGVITGLASLAYCKNLANGAAQSEIDTADTIKEHADRVALKNRDICRENNDYVAKRRSYWRVIGRTGRSPHWLKEKARADHQKCVEFFRNQAGDCGTSE